MENQHIAKVVPSKKTGRRQKLRCPEGVERVINEYFDRCEEKGKPLTMSGLAYALGIDRQTLIRLGKQDEFYDTIKRAKDRVAAYAEERLYSGGNATGVIFSLKNNFGWVDKQEVKQEISADVNANVEAFFKDKEQDA